MHILTQLLSCTIIFKIMEHLVFVIKIQKKTWNEIMFIRGLEKSCKMNIRRFWRTIFCGLITTMACLCVCVRGLGLHFCFTSDNFNRLQNLQSNVICLDMLPGCFYTSGAFMCITVAVWHDHPSNYITVCLAYLPALF